MATPRIVDSIKLAASPRTKLVHIERDSLSLAFVSFCGHRERPDWLRMNVKEVMSEEFCPVCLADARLKRDELSIIIAVADGDG